MFDIEPYINSGIVESYVIGLASLEEAARFEHLCREYPALDLARRTFEERLDLHSLAHAERPPEYVRQRVVDRINELPVIAFSPARSPERGLFRWFRSRGRRFFFKPKRSDFNGFVAPGFSNAPSASPAYSLSSDADKKIRNRVLLERILANPAAMDQLSWLDFEVFISDLLIVLGFTATHTSKTKDGGKDVVVLLQTIFGDFTFYVECKHKVSKRKVGVAIVRAVYGTVVRDVVAAGVVITNSYFSPAAVEYQRPVSERIKLVNRDKLFEWISLINRGGHSDAAAVHSSIN